MSSSAIYSNVKIKAKQAAVEASGTAADNDDMTYSEVNIQSQGRPYGAEGRDVIYSVINQHPQNDPGGSVLVKLADASPQTKSRWPVLSKPCLTVLLTCICVLLLIITCTMGGLYAVMKKSHADEKERLISDGRESKKNLEKASANYKSLESRLNITLQGLNGNLSECHRTLTEQKETISLISKEKQDLQSNLSDIQQEKLRSKKLLKSIEMFKKDSNRPRSDSVVEGLQKGCLLGWVFFKEKCYYVSTDEKNWENSRVECEEMGGHLLNIDNKDKLNFFTKYNIYYDQYYWIGNVTKYFDGRNWRSLESSVQSCVAVNYQYYQPRYYYDCNSEWRRVCESSPVK